MASPLLIGERLVRDGVITEQQLDQALEVRSRSQAFIGQIMVDLGFVKVGVMGSILARELGVPYIDLLDAEPSPEAAHLVPEEIVRSAQCLGLWRNGETMGVAMVDPLDVATIDRIHQATGLRVVPYLTMAGPLQRAVNEFFSASARTHQALRDLAKETQETDRGHLSRAVFAAASEPPIVRLVDSIIESAIAMRASDIHFEPRERSLRARFRVDGALVEHGEIPRAQLAATMARLKILASMDVTETRRPQDGRIRYDNHGRAYDIRVSSVPTVGGEKAVLRILDKSLVLVPLSHLGFQPEQQRQFESLIRRPHGMVIVVGPTGSGKSTTLYASLNMLNDTSRNIMTLEDPVEYHVPGLNQVQVNPKISLTFAAGLRTFVRQDPDVILVGEIRDDETAAMAVQASLTGHLLLSTLHANSAVGTVSRMTNLGVDPFLIGQALSGVVSQRLVPKVCNNCAIAYRPTREVLDVVGIGEEEAEGMSFRRGRGCRACQNRGYTGRLGLFEVMVVDDEVRRHIIRGASEQELQQVAERQGMQPMRVGGLDAIRAGITTPEEIGRVVLRTEV
jgi:type IV pilus assembly protein PilB